ncbi:MAG TPA: lysophospholipid acyltransferase family protein [Burkholderiales bacterium]
MSYGWVVLAALVVAGAWLWRRALKACEAAQEADWGGRWLNRLDGLNRIFCRRFHGLPRQTLELPAEGPVLVASNHVSGLDPLLLIAASRRPLRFMIAREEYERWWFKWLFRAIGCIPVDRSRDPHKAFYAARRALEAGEVVALFPQGRIHPDHLPPIPLRRGVVVLAHMTGAPILPVRITGVRGQGWGAPAVLMRSKARLHPRPLLRCERKSAQRCLEELTRALHDPPGGD